MIVGIDLTHDTQIGSTVGDGAQTYICGRITNGGRQSTNGAKHNAITNEHGGVASGSMEGFDKVVSLLGLDANYERASPSDSINQPLWLSRVTICIVSRLIQSM